jgi:hypothetical protein
VVRVILQVHVNYRVSNMTSSRRARIFFGFITCNVALTPDSSRQSRLGVVDLDRVESSRFIDSSRLESTSSRSQPSCTVGRKNTIGDKLGTWSNFVTGVTESCLVTLRDFAVTAQFFFFSLLRFFNLQST